jgi:hypothetical protein
MIQRLDNEHKPRAAFLKPKPLSCRNTKRFLDVQLSLKEGAIFSQPLRPNFYYSRAMKSKRHQEG